MTAELAAGPPGSAPMHPVPMHPEATDDPRKLRWMVPAGTLPVVGEIVGLPAELDALRVAGVVESVCVEIQAVVIRVFAGVAWSAVGAEVRTALAAALRSPNDWVPAAEIGDDDVLRAALEDVLAGAAGGYIRSHGGEVIIQSVRGGRASVRMRGTCSHCPAAGWTLHLRLEAELRKRYPGLVELTAVGATAA